MEGSRGDIEGSTYPVDSTSFVMAGRLLTACKKRTKKKRSLRNGYIDRRTYRETSVNGYKIQEEQENDKNKRAAPVKAESIC